MDLGHEAMNAKDRCEMRMIFARMTMAQLDLSAPPENRTDLGRKPAFTFKNFIRHANMTMLVHRALISPLEILRDHYQVHMPAYLVLVHTT